MLITCTDLKAQISGVHRESTAPLKSEVLRSCVELQNAHDHDRLNEVQRLLGLDDFSEEAHRKGWDKHNEAVDKDDDLNAEMFQQMRGSKLDSFRACEDYQSWAHSERSCLLILSGYNNFSLEVDQCWLSPIAAAAVKDFDQQDIDPIYAYFALPQKGKLLYDVVAVILLQLLRRKSGSLRNERQHAELRTELGRFRQTGLDESDKVLAMERVALRVIDFFEESETLYIVVDRADRCRDPKVVDHRKALLRIFVKMVEAARCTLRVLAVIDGHSWRVENYRDELGAKMEGRVIVRTEEQETRDYW